MAQCSGFTLPFSFQVPTFVTEDGVKISQSLPIIEFLDEKYPDKTQLLPKDILLRAKVTFPLVLGWFLLSSSFALYGKKRFA